MSIPPIPAQAHHKLSLRQLRGSDPGIERIHRWFEAGYALAKLDWVKQSKLAWLYKYWFKWQGFLFIIAYVGLVAIAEGLGWVSSEASGMAMGYGFAAWGVWFSAPFAILTAFVLLGIVSLFLYPCVLLFWALGGLVNGRYRQPKRIDIGLRIDAVEIEGHVSVAGRPRGRVSRSFAWFESSEEGAILPIRATIVRWPPPRRSRRSHYEDWISTQLESEELPPPKGRHGWALVLRTGDGDSWTYSKIQDTTENIRHLHESLRFAIDDAVRRHGRGEAEVPEALREIAQRALDS